MRRRFIVLMIVTVAMTALPVGAAADIEPPVSTTENVVVVAVDPSGAATAPLQVPDFSMLGAQIPDGLEVQVRVRRDAAAAWGSWTTLERLGDDDSGPDAGSTEDGVGRWRSFSEPLWTGPATQLQLRGAGLPGAVRVHLIDAIGKSPGLAGRMGSALRSAFGTPPAHAGARQDIVSRRGWGANESWRTASPSYMRQVRAGTLHHTAGSNTYKRSEARAVVRGIYHYHTRTLGWSDIGYHFLVDRFGTVYEGRAGGMDKPVLGAHAGGFNTDTFGISIMGSFDQQAPSVAAQRAVIDTTAWKMAHHGINRRGTVTLTSAGSTRYESGRRVKLPRFFAHRDVSATACPGAKAYPLMGALRRGKITHPPAIRAVPTRPAPNGPFPLFGDWNGDGVKTPGWWRAGVVSIRLTNTSGSAHHRFRYGRPGDVPVVGDWNGDGRDSVSVVRNGTWRLRNRMAAGPPDRRFRYGRKADWPIVGDWDGDGRDGIGVVRGKDWLLRQQPSSGPAHVRFRYGRINDWPLVGDWDGDGRTTPGLVRGDRWYQRTKVAGGRSKVVRFGPPKGRPVAGQALPVGGSNLVRVRGSRWLIRHHDGVLTQTVEFSR